MSFKNDVTHKSHRKVKHVTMSTIKKREILLQLLAILRSKGGLPLIIVVLTMIEKTQNQRAKSFYRPGFNIYDSLITMH